MKQKLYVSVGIIAVLGIFLILLIGGYSFNWTWTGFGSYTLPKTNDQDFHPAKTLWDWMQLIIIPAVLAGAAISFNARNSRTQLKIADENNLETALQNYLDKMSGYLESKGKEDSQDGVEVQKIVRTKTLTMLRRLDINRIKIVVQFLRDSQLISAPDALVDLHGVDLSKANLRGVNLRSVSLSGANLSEIDLRDAGLFSTNLRGAILYRANLREAFLNDADLRDANLREAFLNGADLRGAKLYSADLSWADLRGAAVTEEQLGQAGCLGGATLPTGSKHD